MAPAREAPVWARGMVAALQRGDHRQVLRQADMALEAAQGDPALLARVHTWLAQAWIKDGDLEQARDHIRLAIRAVKEAGDEAGLDQIRALRRQVLDQLRQADAPPPAPPAPPPAEGPLGEALAALALGEPDRALALATTAREQARAQGDAKAEVIALLAIARVPGHAEAAVLAARDRADQADDMNLLAAVARAARELGVELPAHVF